MEETVARSVVERYSRVNNVPFEVVRDYVEHDYGIKVIDRPAEVPNV